jgi:hypothetical protein
MKLSLIFLALALAIVACSDSGTFVTSVPGSDYNAVSQMATADYAMQQAQQMQAHANAAAVNETAQAQAANGVLSVAAMATDQALGMARAQLVMTADAANFSSTQSAVIAQQTEQAITVKATVDARAMLLAQQQAQATATAQVMLAQQTVQAIEAKAASASRRQRELISWLIPVLAVIAFGLVLLLGAKLMGGMSDSQAPPAIAVLSSDDRLLAERAEVGEEAARDRLAMKLIRDAITHVGAQSNRIPPAVQLGWLLRAWTLAVAILRPYGVEILQGANGGTYLVGEYSTLQALYAVIGEKHLTSEATGVDQPEETADMVKEITQPMA